MRYYTLNNPAISLAKNMLAHNLRTRLLPDKGFVVKYKQQFVSFKIIYKKNNDKIFQKIEETFLTHFAHFSNSE